MYLVGGGVGTNLSPLESSLVWGFVRGVVLRLRTKEPLSSLLWFLVVVCVGVSLWGRSFFSFSCCFALLSFV